MLDEMLYDDCYGVNTTTTSCISSDKKQELKNKILKNKDPLIKIENIDINTYSNRKSRSYSKTTLQELENMFVNKLLLTNKHSENDNEIDYYVKIISKENCFLIKTETNIFKIDKHDILNITVDNYSKKIEVDLKNKTNKLVISLNSIYSNIVIDELYIDIEYTYDSKKIIDFLFNELESYVSKLNLISNL